MPIVTLTTDFGTRDAFVAAMKGMILGIAPDATIVDVTHEIDARDVWGGAIALLLAAPHFPRGVVHVAVVDPGVGSERAGIVIAGEEAAFVGPDNGVLTLAAPAGAPAFRIADAALLGRHVSPTFHGRDVFAPVAAHLARGLGASDVGPPYDPVPVRLRWPEAPEVVHADRFGNLLLSLRALPEGATAIEIEGLGRAPLRRTFSDVAPGEIVSYIGSAGLVEVAVRDGSAAERLAASARPTGRGSRAGAATVRGVAARIVR
ncbi:MAG: SAM-dependent chlorinase/fluorinase [Myxococcota bacterium]